MCYLEGSEGQRDVGGNFGVAKYDIKPVEFENARSVEGGQKVQIVEIILVFIAFSERSNFTSGRPMRRESVEMQKCLWSLLI